MSSSPNEFFTQPENSYFFEVNYINPSHNREVIRRMLLGCTTLEEAIAAVIDGYITKPGYTWEFETNQTTPELCTIAFWNNKQQPCSLTIGKTIGQHALFSKAGIDFATQRIQRYYALTSESHSKHDSPQLTISDSTSEKAAKTLLQIAPTNEDQFNNDLSSLSEGDKDEAVIVAQGLMTQTLDELKKATNDDLYKVRNSYNSRFPGKWFIKLMRLDANPETAGIKVVHITSGSTRSDNTYFYLPLALRDLGYNYVKAKLSTATVTDSYDALLALLKEAPDQSPDQIKDLATKSIGLINLVALLSNLENRYGKEVSEFFLHSLNATAYQAFWTHDVYADCALGFLLDKLNITHLIGLRECTDWLNDCDDFLQNLARFEEFIISGTAYGRPHVDPLTFSPSADFNGYRRKAMVHCFALAKKFILANCENIHDKQAIQDRYERVQITFGFPAVSSEDVTGSVFHKNPVEGGTPLNPTNEPAIRPKAIQALFLLGDMSQFFATWCKDISEVVCLHAVQKIWRGDYNDCNDFLKAHALSELSTEAYQQQHVRYRQMFSTAAKTEENVLDGLKNTFLTLSDDVRLLLNNLDCENKTVSIQKILTKGKIIMENTQELRYLKLLNEFSKQPTLGDLFAAFGKLLNNPEYSNVSLLELYGNVNQSVAQRQSMTFDKDEYARIAKGLFVIDVVFNETLSEADAAKKLVDDYSNLVEHPELSLQLTTAGKIENNIKYLRDMITKNILTKNFVTLMFLSHDLGKSHEFITLLKSMGVLDADHQATNATHDYPVEVLFNHLEASLFEQFNAAHLATDLLDLIGHTPLVLEQPLTLVSNEFLHVKYFIELTEEKEVPETVAVRMVYLNKFNADLAQLQLPTISFNPEQSFTSPIIDEYTRKNIVMIMLAKTFRIKDPEKAKQLYDLWNNPEMSDENKKVIEDFSSHVMNSLEGEEGYVLFYNIAGFIHNSGPFKDEGKSHIDAIELCKFLMMQVNSHKDRISEANIVTNIFQSIQGLELRKMYLQKMVAIMRGSVLNVLINHLNCDNEETRNYYKTFLAEKPNYLDYIYSSTGAIKIDEVIINKPGSGASNSMFGFYTQKPDAKIADTQAEYNTKLPVFGSTDS